MHRITRKGTYKYMFSDWCYWAFCIRIRVSHNSCVDLLKSETVRSSTNLQSTLLQKISLDSETNQAAWRKVADRRLSYREDPVFSGVFQVLQLEQSYRFSSAEETLAVEATATIALNVLSFCFFQSRCFSTLQIRLVF